MIRLPIKMLFDFDENEYVCFIDSNPKIEGRGETEPEAIKDFQEKLELASKD